MEAWVEVAKDFVDNGRRLMEGEAEPRPPANPTDAPLIELGADRDG
jgi:hypothetical protein